MPKTGVPNPTQSMAASKLPSKEAVRPWEDGSLSAEVRFESYKEVVKAKVEAILEALQREGITDAEKFKLMHEPDTQFWSQEIKQVNSETAEQFCERMDREVIPKLLGKNFLGPDQWQQGFQVYVGAVPPIPKSITRALLESECPLHPGEKIKDTHILMLVPKEVNGEPYSAVKLGELCSSRKGSGYRLIYDREDWANKWKAEAWAKVPQLESEWVLIPKSDPDPWKMREKYPADGDERHFRSKRISRPKDEREPDCKEYQSDVHEQHYSAYREAKAIEVMTAALLNDVVNGEPRMLDGWNYLRCVEPNASGGRVLVGYFLAVGLKVNVGNVDRDFVDVGRSLAWKSKS